MKTSFIYFFISLTIVLIVSTNYSPPRGWVFTPTIERPAGFAEFEKEVKKREIIDESKRGRSLKASRFGPLGFAQYTFDTILPPNSENGSKKAFLTLHNLYVKKNSGLDGSEYFIEKEKPFIIKGNRKEALPFYLDLNARESRETDAVTTRVMLPISKSIEYILKGLWFVSVAIGLFLFVGIILGGIIRLIEEIAKGNAFTKYTIIILRNIFYTVLAIPLIYLIGSFAIWFYMNLKYPGEFGLDPAVYFSSARIMLVAVFFYALYRAFKNGYELQQENELTV